MLSADAALTTLAPTFTVSGSLLTDIKVTPTPTAAKPDKIDVKIAVNTDPTKIRSVIVLQEMIYSIDSIINADIKKHFFNQFDTPNGFTSLTVQGEIQLH